MALPGLVALGSLRRHRCHQVTDRRRAFERLHYTEAGFEKQRFSFSRRGPSFWPLDRCRPFQPDLSLVHGLELLIGAAATARRSTTTTQAGAPIQLDAVRWPMLDNDG